MNAIKRVTAILGTIVALAAVCTSTAYADTSKSTGQHVIPCPQLMGAPGQTGLGTTQGWVYTSPAFEIDVHNAQGTNFVAGAGCIGLHVH